MQEELAVKDPMSSMSQLINNYGTVLIFNMTSDLIASSKNYWIHAGDKKYCAQHELCKKPNKF